MITAVVGPRKLATGDLGHVKSVAKAIRLLRLHAPIMLEHSAREFMFTTVSYDGRGGIACRSTFIIGFQPQMTYLFADPLPYELFCQDVRWHNREFLFIGDLEKSFYGSALGDKSFFELYKRRKGFKKKNGVWSCEGVEIPKWISSSIGKNPTKYKWWAGALMTYGQDLLLQKDPHDRELRRKRLTLPRTL